MPRKSKYSSNTKVDACELYLYENMSMIEICELFDIPYNFKRHKCSIYDWLYVYRQSGREGFFHTKGNKSYSKEFKQEAVEAYLIGNDSINDIATKYERASHKALRRQILQYNSNRKLKYYVPKREVYMAKSRRKTTIEERKEIVEYCINLDRNYKDTALLYGVPYSQVYSWVKKYDANGIESLIDKPGHHKIDDGLDELELLRRENLRLKRQLEEKDILTELLKKVKDFEGM